MKPDPRDMVENSSEKLELSSPEELARASWHTTLQQIAFILMGFGVSMGVTALGAPLWFVLFASIGAGILAAKLASKVWP